MRIYFTKLKKTVYGGLINTNVYTSYIYTYEYIYEFVILYRIIKIIMSYSYKVRSYKYYTPPLYLEKKKHFFQHALLFYILLAISVCYNRNISIDGNSVIFFDVFLHYYAIFPDLPTGFFYWFIIIYYFTRPSNKFFIRTWISNYTILPRSSLPSFFFSPSSSRLRSCSY